MVPVESVTGQTCYAPLVGGAIFNTAIGLGRLGIQVGMLSGVSTDLFGQHLADALQASNVSTSYLIRSKLPTTLAFVALNGGQASYTFYDENTSGRSLNEADLPSVKALGKDLTALYCGGISLISEPSADTFCALVLQHAANKVIIVDPNIRISFISDEPSYRERLKQIIDVCDIVKVSDEDLHWLVSSSPELDPSSSSTIAKTLSETEQVGQLRGLSNAIVVVTKGAQGATAYLANGQSVHQGVPKVTVVDTVGAGDTFNAGFIARLAELGLMSKSSLADISLTALSDALAHGAKVAGVTVSRQGANPPWSNEL